MARSLALVAIAFLSACAPASSLVVQLTSDLVPGTEVDRAVVEIRRDGEVVDTSRRDLLGLGSFGRPARLRTVEGLAEGLYDVRLRLERAGAPVVSREVRVRVSGETLSTILVTRTCGGIVCPDAADGSPTSCLGDRCVPAECTEEHPERCGPAACAADADCSVSALACVTNVCTASGTCFARADDGACASTELCSTLAGCVTPSGVFFDIAEGLRANTVTDAGPGTRAAQRGADGWHYHYDPTTSFGVYGMLPPELMEPAGYRPMETTRSSEWRGWYAEAGLQIGARCVVALSGWSTVFLDITGDSVVVLPENSCQVVVEWRAPVRGHALVELDVSSDTGVEGDVEVHLFVRRASTSDELRYAYISNDTAPDAHGVTPELVTLTDPLHLVAEDDLEAGDSYFVYVRVGDDDATDFATFRGGVHFTTAD